MQSLASELDNNIITFVNNDGNTVATFDFIEKEPYFFGELTNDMEVKLINKTHKSKYYKMLEELEELDDSIFTSKNMKIYKIVVSKNMFSEKYNYILLITHNPHNNGKFKLIIYNICFVGVYFKYLLNIGSYTSTI